MVIASAPGKIMLAGEYTVLFGGRALALTLDKRLSVTVTTRRPGSGTHVSCELWPDPRILPDVARLSGRSADGDPLMSAVAYGLKLFEMDDVAVSVQSDLRVSYGIGSSSALRLGVLLALNELAPVGMRLAYLDAARHAWILQRDSQALASGYDLATQLTGGLVTFRNPSAQRPLLAGPTENDPDQWPIEITRHTRLLEPARELAHPFVGGRGAPTGKVTGETLVWLDQTGRLEALMQASEELIDAFYAALSERFDASAQAYLIAAAREHRSLFVGAPHYPEAIVAALAQLPGFDRTWSFKTTGAGGEDAVLLIGEPTCLALATETLYRMGWDRLPARFATDGARVGSST